MLSAGNPVPGATMATVEAQVSRAQRSMVARTMPPPWNDTGMAGAGTVGPGAMAGAAWALVARAVVRVTAATTAPPARSWRRVATNRVRVTALSVMRFPCSGLVGMGSRDAGRGFPFVEPAWKLLEAVGQRPSQLSAGPLTWCRAIGTDCESARAKGASRQGWRLLRRVRGGYGVEQLDRVVVLGVLQDVLGLASLDDASVVEHQDLVGNDAGPEQVVGDVQQAEPALLAQLGQQSQDAGAHRHVRSEEHTSELQSRQYLVCRL